jgi:hypothetical protein
MGWLKLVLSCSVLRCSLTPLTYDNTMPAVTIYLLLIFTDGLA